MNRFSVLAVVGLMTLGATGCATGVEDPQPTPKAPTQAHAPTAQPFSATDVDTSKVDPTKIGTGLDAPKPDLEFDRPIPTNGDKFDTDRVETEDQLDPKLPLEEAPVNG